MPTEREIQNSLERDDQSRDEYLGAGGGQAGDVNLAPVLVHGEPRPVDAPGPSLAEGHNKEQGCTTS